MEYRFSTREKDGSVCLILAYKVGKKWHQKTKQGFRNMKEARKYQDELLAAAKKEARLTLDPALKNITLSEFLPIFLRDRKEELTYTTRVSYQNCLKRL